MQSPGFFRTRTIFKNLSNMSDYHACSEPWQGHNSLFRHFRGYLQIFRYIGLYSATLTGTQLGRNEGASPVIFENRKKCPHSGKRDPDCVHHWIKFYFKIVALRASRRKAPKCGASFSCVLIKYLCFWRNISILMPSFTIPTPPILLCKIFGCAPALRHYYFCKTLNLKLLTVLWKLLSR